MTAATGRASNAIPIPRVERYNVNLPMISDYVRLHTITCTNASSQQQLRVCACACILRFCACCVCEMFKCTLMLAPTHLIITLHLQGSKAKADQRFGEMNSRFARQRWRRRRQCSDGNGEGSESGRQDDVTWSSAGENCKVYVDSEYCIDGG